MAKFFSTVSMGLISALFVAQGAMAASSVYYCDETGSYGYSYDAKNVAEAKKIALEGCKEYEGTNCKELISTDKKGYGAIAVGVDKDGLDVIGAVLGAKSEKEAVTEATKTCKEAGGTKVKIEDKWKDK